MEDRTQQKESECGVMDESPAGQRPLRLGTKAGPSFETIVAASRRLPLSPRSSFVGPKPSSPKFVGLRRLGIPSPIGTGKEESSAEIATHSNQKKGSPRRSFRNFHHTIDTGFSNVRGAEIHNNSPVAGSGDSLGRSDPPSRPQLSVTDQRFSAMVKTASPAAAFAAARGSKLQIRKIDAHRNRTDSADSASVRSFTVNTEAEGKKNLSETEINRLVRSSIEKARRNAKMSKAAAKESVSYKTVSQTILASTVSTRSTIQEDGNGKSSLSKLDAKEGRQDDAVESQRDEATSQVRNRAPSTITGVTEKSPLESLESVDSLSARKTQPSPRFAANESLRHFFSAGEGETKQRSEPDCGGWVLESGGQNAAGSTGFEPHGCQSPTSPITGRSPISPSSVHSLRSGSSTLSERVQVSLERAKMARDEIAELLNEGPAESNSRSRVDFIVAETMRRAKEAADNDNASSSVISLHSVKTKQEIEPRVLPEDPTSPCSVDNGARVERIDTAMHSPRSLNTNKPEPAVPSASDISQVVEVESQKTACVPSESQNAVKDPTYDDTSQQVPTPSSPQNESMRDELPPGVVVSSKQATPEEASTCELRPTAEISSTKTPEAKLASVASTPKSADAPVLQVPACTETRTKAETRLKSEAFTYKDLLLSMSAELKESLAAARPNEDVSSNSSCTSSDLASDNNQGSKSIKGKIGIVFGASSVLTETVEQEELYVVDDEKKTKILQSTLSLCDAPDRGLEVALIPQSETSCSEETMNATDESSNSTNSNQDGGETFAERAESPASTRSESFVSAVQDHPESDLRAIHSAQPTKESHSSIDESALSKGVVTGVGETFQSISSAIKCADQAKTTPKNNSSEEMKSLHTEIDDRSKNSETHIVETAVSADDEFLGTTILSPVMPSDASELSGRSGKYSRSMHPRRQARRKNGKQRLARSPSNGSQDTITVTEEFLAEIASRKGATMTTDELNQLLRATINPKMPQPKIETIKSSGSEESVLESNALKTEGSCQSKDRGRNPTLYSSRSSQESRVSQHSRNTNGSQSTQESRLSAMQQRDGRFCVDFIDMLRQLGFRDVAEDHITINEDSLPNNSLSGSYSDDFISDDETNNESELAGDEVSFVKDEDVVNNSKYDGDGEDDELTIADKKSSIVRSEEETFDHETAGSVSYESRDGETHESFTQEDRRRVTFSFSDGQFTLDDFASTSSEEDET